MVVFKNLDTDKNGKLSREELIQGFLKVSSKKSEQEIVKEVDKLLEDIDTNHSGEIDFTEFVVAAMKRDKMVTRQKLE
jgi:calcium-dependent protein kinase